MKKNTRGFTIVELLFSTVIFSLVMLLCLTGLVQIGRMYYKGVTTAQTQQAGRALLDELSQSMQFSNSNIKLPSGIDGAALPALSSPLNAVNGTVANGVTGYFCIGTTRYTYAMDRMQGNTNDPARKMIKHALWADEPGVCAGASADTLNATAPVNLMDDAPSAPAFNGRDLLSDNMRLTRLRLNSLNPGTDTVWQILITVAYGEDDLLVLDPTSGGSRRYCAGKTVGTQFCAFTELGTIVKRRVQ